MNPDELARAVKAIDRTDPAGAALADGVERFLRGEAGERLDDALELSRADRFAWRLTRRNAWLREAARYTGASTTWTQAVALDAAIRLFLSARARHDREASIAPSDGLRAALWHARRFGALPGLRQLDRVLSVTDIRTDGNDSAGSRS